MYISEDVTLYSVKGGPLGVLLGLCVTRKKRHTQTHTYYPSLPDSLPQKKKRSATL